MALILGLMILGMITGFILGKYPILLKINDKLLNAAIYILILLLGIAVGSNDKIINNLFNTGIQALTITIGAIAGSVAMCWLIYKAFFHLK
ncbi:MAG: LysO family transporter [Mariniphaga sp.]